MSIRPGGTESYEETQTDAANRRQHDELSRERPRERPRRLGAGAGTRAGPKHQPERLASAGTVRSKTSAEDT